MDTVYDALNAVGRVPWQINKKVLDVVKSLWEQGGGVAGKLVGLTKFVAP